MYIENYTLHCHQNQGISENNRGAATIEKYYV